MKRRKKIAIIGAGIFGCTLAIILSKKFDVQIFEKKRSILNEASKMNQFRFHLGFHYPRSQKTINEIQKDCKDFIKFLWKKFMEIQTIIIWFQKQKVKLTKNI